MTRRAVFRTRRDLREWLRSARVIALLIQADWPTFYGEPVFRPLAEEIDPSGWLYERIGMLSAVDYILSPMMLSPSQSPEPPGGPLQAA
jgi:hypothetical protein